MQFKFIKYTKLWLTISLAIILIGFGAMVRNQIETGHILNWGIDFTGGSLMEYQFEDSVTTIVPQELSATIDQVLPSTVSQITVTGEGTYLIHARDLTEEELTQIREAIHAQYGNFEMLRFTTIGPKIGATLKQKAMMALAVALIAIVLYIAYAFRHVPKRVSAWRFGFCAILALIHDVLIAVGFFAIMRFEIDSLFITALLTIIGFSVHDTIVVFDRIRENLKKQSRDDTFGDIADISLNQTMTRSINTSISTLFPLVALYIWGAPSLHHFIFALIIGIIVGTYSSIFIASPVLTFWQEKKRIR
ncbi:protein translocase subunit SecF [Candidatus Peregrinibacteria bacterium CG_4_10_14_0_2_um_filter_43_11]|nr:MAG: protein translocase subunit SecF [Candidatus Peregrinibacteria bacterium CG_4_10_14_0_2_um_filter_43_11]